MDGIEPRSTLFIIHVGSLILMWNLVTYPKAFENTWLRTVFVPNKEEIRELKTSLIDISGSSVTSSYIIKVPGIFDDKYDACVTFYKSSLCTAGWLSLYRTLNVGLPQNRGWILRGVKDPSPPVPGPALWHSLQVVEFRGASSLGKATEAFNLPLSPIQCNEWNVLGAQPHVCMTWCWQNWRNVLHPRPY